MNCDGIWERDTTLPTPFAFGNYQTRSYTSSGDAFFVGPPLADGRVRELEPAVATTDASSPAGGVGLTSSAGSSVAAAGPAPSAEAAGLGAHPPQG